MSKVEIGINDLETWCLENNHTELLDQWHPTKNGELKPKDVARGSAKKIWWYLPYDDPKTGKHFEFEWIDTLAHRTNDKRGCPFLSVPVRAIWAGFNDFETWCYINSREDLLKEWHPTKNGDLKPSSIPPKSSSKIWWYLPYDDPKTGKHFDFEWQSTLLERTGHQAQKCPYLVDKEIWKGYNDFETWCVNNQKEDLLKEWHPTKNGVITPSDIFASSNQKVWWYLPYDDPNSGEHFELEWKASVVARESGAICPFLSKKAITQIKKGINDFETWCIKNNRTDLLEEWHPTKNKGLLPSDISKGSDCLVWWYLPYDDPTTGKHFNFEWEAKVVDRTGTKQAGCPFISSKRVWPGYNDFKTWCLENGRENVIKEWHPSKNGESKPEDFLPSSNQRVWWLLSYDDPASGEHFDFEWQTSIVSRKSGTDCPYICKGSGKKVSKGFNDLETWCKKNNRIDLLREWHPTKNGILKPSDVVSGSHKKVWWYLPYDDPKTGKHFEFEWESVIKSRTGKQDVGCPYISNKAVCTGFNDLETWCILNERQDLLEEWHPVKNKELLPSEFTPMSGQKVWWLLSYDDPKTGKHFDFEWQSTIASRTSDERGGGCPYLSNRAVWSGFNDLETWCQLNNREDIITEWHPTKNGDLKPCVVSPQSNQKVWWYLPYDDPKTGKHFDFEWYSEPCVRTGPNNQSCPYLSNHALYKGFNDLETWCQLNDREYLIKEWHPTKNGNLKPCDFTPQNAKKVWWYLPYDDPKTGKHFDFEWCAAIYSRTGGNNTDCPYLSVPPTMIWPGFNDLESWCITNNRTDLIDQWDHEKNAEKKMSEYFSGTATKVWWKCSNNHRWKSAIAGRTRANLGCPICSESHLEYAITRYLISNDYEISIDFIPQYRPGNELIGTGGGLLSFDFYIHKGDTEAFIECQGIQHYEAIEFFGGKKQLENQKEHDKRKRDYAKRKGIKLIEIKYDCDNVEKILIDNGI